MKFIRFLEEEQRISRQEKHYLTRKETKQIHGALFLNAFIIFEGFIEDIFLGLVSGEIKSPKVKPKVEIANRRIAREIVFGGKGYFDWFPEPNLQRCDINQMLEAVVSLVHPKADSQDIKIQKKFDYMPLELNMDREQMRQAFLNIMLNAIEAMPYGGVLEVTTVKNEDRKLKNFLEIKIKDTGLGIAPDLKKRLFEPFFTTKTEGTGLGLFITSKIVQMHKSLIEIDSEAGKGTTVVIKLPININAVRA